VSSVLFDVPGPQARRRALVGTVVAAVLAAALLAVVLWKLNSEGEFEAELWEDLRQSNIARAIWMGLVATLSAAASGTTLMRSGESAHSRHMSSRATSVLVRTSVARRALQP